MIVCLGWGSLIWDPRNLPLVDRRPEAWRDDGPDLPLEFARVSEGGRLTLVIHHEAPPVRVLWNELAVLDVQEAVEALRDREGTKKSWIGRWSGGGSIRCLDAINDWAQTRNLNGVVWSAMPPKFSGQNGQSPTETEAVEHLAGLSGCARVRAEEYVRKAPPQIDTPFRRAITHRLAWISVSSGAD